MSTSLFRPLQAGGLLGCMALAALAGCGRHEPGAATQVAVRVNERDITVHQINQVLAQTRQVGPDQVQAASREVLERLVDQELALQQALDQKIDREPAVVAAVEASRREVVARAYMERVLSSVGAPAAAEVEAYFREHPELFAERQVYTLIQVEVALPEARLAELRSKAQEGSGAQALTAWLAAQSLPHAAKPATQAAESLPLELLRPLARLPAGQGLVWPTPAGAQVWYVLARQAAPVTLAQASPAIGLALANERKRLAAQAEVQRLRAVAKLEYQGPFASAAPINTMAAAAQPPAQGASVAAATGATALNETQLKKGLGL